MANNEPQDQERDIERLLRDHFASEGQDFRAPDDLWLRLESRLGEQRGPFQPSAIRDALFPVTGRWWTPAIATAGVAAVAVGVTVAVLSTGGDSSADLASLPPAPLPEATAAPSVELLELEPAVNVQGTRITVKGSGMANDDAMEEQPDDYAMYEEEPMTAPYDEEVHPDVAAAMAAAEPASTAAEKGAVGASGPQGDAGPQSGTPSATEFQDYGRLPFTAAFDDPVSTFSLDTDRTSYHLALNWARNAYEVDPDSVRAEEWINAFDYGYQPPPSRREFAIYSDVARHPLDDRLHLARVAFQAPEIRDDTPLNVTLVLDASGSMSQGNRVDIAREAAETIRNSLGSKDRIAVVHFTNSVIHEFTVEHRGPDDRQVSRSISNLAPHGSTNVQAGLDLGVQLADQARQERPDAYNYIILMSDGVANVDATDPFAILESAYDPDRGNPLRIITVGVGIENYNDYLLEQLAQHGDGWYRYLSDVDQARATFNRQNWLALSAPFADQARAQVTWDPDIVRSWRIVGYENRVTPDSTFTQDRKEFAELPSGAATTVFYELELHPEWDRLSQRQRLAGIEVKWVDPATGQSRSQRSALGGQLNVGFQRHADHWMQFGAIVGLAADRYSGLNDERRGYESYLAHTSYDLDRLLDLLEPLRNDLGQLVAYNDFRFLLGHIAQTVKDQAPEPTTPSGYSP